MVVLLAQLDPTGIFDLGNTSLIFWEVITFLILLFLLVRYVYPPIRKQIQERQAEIERSIDEAEKTRAEARELLAEYRRQIEEARGEGRRILEEARKQAETQRERTKKDAREEGDRIIQRAREEIDRERESAVREVRREVADMVVQASEQVIGRSIDRDEHERLISQALDDLESEVAGAASSAGDGSGSA
jgi:F-type H+-transporting ATPase subunit b